MPRFRVTRSLPPLDSAQVRAVARAVVEACDEMDGMAWIRSHVTADGKHSFCELEAPSAEECRKHAALAGLPADDVIPLGLEIGPTDTY